MDQARSTHGAAGGAGGAWPDPRPWTRWWWFSNKITPRQIRQQLEWFRKMGFGGVELAWVYPRPGAPAGVEWLSPGWSELVAHASACAAELGLGCDFTFGSLWPFGGSFVSEEDSSRTWAGPSPQRLRKSWESPVEGRILNHLDAAALERYAARVGAALGPAIRSGRRPGLFCDSWEVQVEGLWSEGFGQRFLERFGYDILPLMATLDDHPDERYDYRKLLAEQVIGEFYAPFARIARRLGCFARIQCHGAPTDLLAAYAGADVPESEALLFDPEFSLIAASAAAVAGRPLVSAESFTCLYGWRAWPGPGQHQGREQAGDLKLLADALFANGVNQIVWHGTPMWPEDHVPGGTRDHWFYASVHVGPDAAFVDELEPFNRYLATICGLMREGRPYTDAAVYLPLEDRWMMGRIAPDKAKPSGHYHWELHDLRPPAELEGFQPTWVSGAMLADAAFEARVLHCGEAGFGSLYIDCEWLDGEALERVLRLARQGLPVCLKRTPRQPGRTRHEGYDRSLAELVALPNVRPRFDSVAVRPPVVSGRAVPPHRCRVVGDDLLVFFAHPAARGLTYPMVPGHHRSARAVELPVEIHWGGRAIALRLRFGAGQSLALRVSGDGSFRFEPTGGWTARAPAVDSR